MTRLRVLHTEIPGYPHLEALTEIRESLVESLRTLGWEVSASRSELDTRGRNIVLGAHVLDDRTLGALPDDTIIYNFEQIDETSMLPPARLAAYGRFDVWDYSERNVSGWAGLGIEATHVPVGHSPVLERIAPADERDIDVLFYGSVNDRRRHVLEEIHRRGHVVRAEFGVYGRERDELIARSRCVLNVHFYEAKILEIVRLSYLFANGVAVVSEWSPDLEVPPGFDDAAAFGRYQELPSLVSDVLGDEDRLERQRLAAVDAMRAQPYTATLEAVLGRPPEGPARPAATGRTGGGTGRKKKKKRR